MKRIGKSLGYQFFNLHVKLAEPLQEALRPLGITVKNYTMMQLIDANPGISQNRLAEMTRKDKTLIGQVINKLERKHLAKREPVENDKRVYALSLTEEGKKIVDDYRHIVSDSESALLATLPAKDKTALRRILDRLMSQA